ncbi:hypothetical protein [Nocardiopsis sp. NPDC006938]|uniref:hypothetical protein n=1 Tax=Nocardiopsis sp. NPDC006938 TaxID=3364337 RepID=UPI0036A340C5
MHHVVDLDAHGQNVLLDQGAEVVGVVGAVAVQLSHVLRGGRRTGETKSTPSTSSASSRDPRGRIRTS